MPEKYDFVGESPILNKPGKFVVATRHGNEKMARLVKITGTAEIDGKTLSVASAWFVPNGTATPSEIREADKLSAEIYATVLGRVKLVTKKRFSEPLRDSFMTFVSEKVSVR